ncbi:gamma-glutamyltransferase [Methyloprofundus sedimenti]|uniref:Glutathione hydrolase proenzyme n=1 Tax=Methyloprofundus sedimenti TaxID=1420851 RepID=A0A1V8M675_9GAMM|nr:gamma-glutamyltransferase [Methyloprofundus sedimenti]OQK17074.1 gamma-glutamyltransferase [Methyloprofundus sedimenti]
MLSSFWKQNKRVKYPGFSSLLLIIVLSITGCSVKQPRQVAIASAHPLATQAGFEILRQGGNVYDAAVAVSAALAVVEPSGSGLGGGGFWLLHRQSDGLDIMIDGREKAPIAARKEMFIDASGEVNTVLSLNGALAAGIPGMPAGLVHLSKKYGNLPLATSLQPAIRYAEQGFIIGTRHQKLLGFRKGVLNQHPETAAIFLKHGQIPDKDSLLIQTDLAQTLKHLADQGKSGFYAGTVADKLVHAVQQEGGIWTLKDLLNYQVVERKPVTGSYKGIKITSAALPSSGGIVLLEALNILENIDLETMDSVTRKHMIVEAMRRAYHDRALYLGDSDFIDVPVDRLIDKHYAQGLSNTIRADQALPSEYLTGHTPAKQGGRNTTHFSIMDNQGNRVAATLSINFPFGAGLVAEGTGVLLNNEMDDFVSAKNSGNGYGLVGGDANSIAPEKRMLSSMTPTFLEDSERIAVLGTPGGSRIISMVLLASLDFAADHSPESWVKVKRFHHQYIPDQILYEKGGLDLQEIEGLQALGHQLKQTYNYGNMQAVQLDKANDSLSAVSDHRGEGFASVQNINE